ncbi:MAG: ABC-F family ATP-binding cassette domain-containing protein [Proteobacteria bacterium]|nr:ABC-F family ATP-binding cassette domain-containing protein [Pseudomonadota bacterium]
MLTIANITYRIGSRTLFDGAAAQVPEGHRVGLVGRNGCGKTTLLALIVGERQVDGGSIEMPRRWRVGVVAQEAPGGDTTPHVAVLAADHERDALLAEAEAADDAGRIADIHARLQDIEAHSAPARAAAILAGLGFDAAMQARPLAKFSGGWRMRVALAAALFAEPDLLLLDEPTNHLDLEATIWLESYLQSYPRTFLLVSHDRHILNSCVTHILHADGGKLALYPGPFDRFERVRAERRLAAEALIKKQDAHRQHMQAFIDRFRYKASKARQAQSRLKALARMEPIVTIDDDPAAVISFPEPPRLRPPLVTFDDVTVGYTPETPVLRQLDLRLDPDDRIALLGANGNGKSTLAKLFAGRLKPMAGKEFRAPKLTCAYFAQHQIEDMDAASTPLQALSRLMRDAIPEKVRARLGRFGFGQDKVNTRIADLSGGEKARLNFAFISHAVPGVLILDEPTNHLDLAAREALIDAINDFTGAVILISHDWHLIELIADRLWLVAEGRVRPFEGDLDDYRRLMLRERTRPAGEQRPKADASSGKESRREAAARRREMEPLRRAAREAEARVAQLTADKAAVEAELAQPEAYGDARRAVELRRRQAELARQLAIAEERWLQAAQALEEASSLA